jgi:multidrug efflux pump subunit AcrA (membrane-fusion protein)
MLYKMKRTTAPVVLALVVALFAVGCSQQQAAEQEPPTPTPIPTPIVPTKPTYKVQRGEVIRQVQFTGRVGPVKETELFFKVNGRVRVVNVERDAEVKQGDLLADLEIEPLERQVAQAELDLERVQTQLERAQKSQEAAVARAQVELSMRAMDVQRLQNMDMDSQRIQAEAALESARLNLERAQAAYDAAPWEGRGASSQAMQLERATLDYRTAKAAYDLAMQQIITGHEYDIRMAQRQVALVQNSIDSLKQGVDPLLVNDVKRAELSLKTMKAQVSDAQIVAPYDGRVMSLRVSPGSPVEGYAPVVVVADPSALEITGEPNSTILTDLKEGMPANVTLVNVPDKAMTGKIRQLPYPYGSGGTTKNETTNAEQDTSTRITIDPESLEGVNLELGDLARVTVVLEKKTDALWLPPQAVRTFEGRKFVVIQDGDGQRRVDVKIGIESEDRVEIEEGLTEGQVAVAP